MQNTEQKTALIAMSGGVDSSIAAYLMRQADFRCMGTTMRLYRNEDLGACNFRTCCSEKDIEDASEVAFQLDIPYEVLDFTLDFQEKIIGKFVRTYEAGGTPNPCIDCNRFMKFDKLPGTPDSGCREILAQRERIASRVACLGQRVPLFMQFSFENPAKGAIL